MPEIKFSGNLSDDMVTFSQILRDFGISAVRLSTLPKRYALYIFMI